MQHSKEMQVVRFSMIVLFSALMVVYLLLYQIKGDKMIINSSNGNDNIVQTGSTNESGSITDLFLETGTDLTLSGTQQSHSGSIINSMSLFGNVSSGNQTTGASESLKLLSGTKLWYGIVDSVEKLSLTYQYALTDDQGIYYVYLGKNTKIDLEKIVKPLGGTIYSLITEKDILKNGLFGDKVVYINLPEYKDKKVVMLLTINGANWLIQTDFAKYYTAKTYLKSVFTQ